jgi:ABC-type cobalamin transport system permease subunit
MKRVVGILLVFAALLVTGLYLSDLFLGNVSKPSLLQLFFGTTVVVVVILAGIESIMEEPRP